MKSFNFSAPKNKIKKISLKYSNLLPKEEDLNKLSLTSSKLTTFRKGINKTKLLFYITGSRSKFFSKNLYRPSTANFNSYSLSKRNTSKLKMPFKSQVQKLFKKNLLLPKNFNVFTPNITSVKTSTRSAYFKQSNDYNSKGNLMKSNFSNNYKPTSTSSVLNINLILNKSTTSSKNNHINFNQNLNLNKNNNNEESDKCYQSDKNIFEAKLLRKKIYKFLKENLTYKNMKKYQIIRAPEYNFKFLKHADAPENVSKFNKQLNSILLKENIGVFQQPLDIIKKGQLSKKFESPRNIELRQNSRKYVDIKDIRFGDFILKDEEEMKKKKKKDTKIILKNFRKKMMEIYLIKENLTIPISEIIKSYKLSNHFLNFEQTKYLNYFIKEKELKCAISILLSNHHLVIDFDQFYMTPLHYAAKNNFYQIIPYLMNYGAYVDAKNSYGKTPLIFCVKKNYYESTVILLSYLADPFVVNNINNYIKEKELDKNMKNILDKIKKIHVKNRLYRDKNFYLSVKNDIYKFVIKECQDLFESDFMNLVKVICKIK